MSTQHITEETDQGEGIVVPFDLPGLHILRQAWQPDGRICVDVIATMQQALCPQCEQVCDKIHDTRARKKRDLFLADHQVELILWKRRFCCSSCHLRFPEPDCVCGRKRRTTAHLWDDLGTQAQSRPVAHVAVSCGVGPRFVQQCLLHVATIAIEHTGGHVDETHPLPTPRFIQTALCELSL